MMKNAERVTGTKKMFREKRFLQKKRLLAVLLLTVLSICLVGGCGSKPVSTQDADILSSYIGFWRYEDTPTYVTINDQYQWATTDFYGNQQDSGVITTDENGLNLSRADGSFVSTLAVTDTGLVDGGGNTLVPSEGLVFLPTAADALNQTIAFPGNFGNVTINYPAQMNAYPYVSYTDSLGFDALVKNGTDDYYTNIMIGFQPIAGYDDNMTKGLASAQPYLENMMQTLLQNMYGANLTQFIGANCIDGGDHYSIVGSMWMSSGIFGDGSSVPLRANMEVRYYGPTGYAMVIMVIAPESRLQNYVDIANNMLTTCAYTAGWHRRRMQRNLTAPVMTESHITGMTATVMSGTGTDMRIILSDTEIPVISMMMASMIITMTAIMMTMIHGQIRVTIMTMMTGIITTTMMIMPMTMKDGAIILTETGRDVSRVSCL